MNILKLTLAAFALAAVFGAVPTFTGFGPTKAQASECKGLVCSLFQRQQMAPALKGSKAPSEPVRCVAVLSDQPSALALRQGKGNTGPAITSWRQASISWKETRRGWEATICFPQRYVGAYSAMSLCGAEGHSSWGVAEISYLKRRDVGSGDPACVGGSRWCAARGL